jgi:uncharacterized protein
MGSDQGGGQSAAPRGGFRRCGGGFEDPLALTQPDPYPTEERFVTLGRDYLERLVLVVWTWRGDDIRLISAREPTPQERRQYSEGPDA